MTRTLKEVKPGETVKLVKYHNTGDIGLRRHLLGMGFVKGAEITVKKVATLGDSVFFDLRRRIYRSLYWLKCKKNKNKMFK